jgi:hypothetical protein
VSSSGEKCRPNLHVSAKGLHGSQERDAPRYVGAVERRYWRERFAVWIRP